LGHWHLYVVGARANNQIDDAELAAIEEKAIPGAGSCGGMYTANTMASAIEALGMSLPGSSAQGVTILHVEAIPICGFWKSSFVNPTACSIARLGARSMPSTTLDEKVLVLLSWTGSCTVASFRF
jgi:hypothetical protein